MISYVLLLTADGTSARFDAVLCVFFDLPLTFTENFQLRGINHQMRNFSQGIVLKLTLTDYFRLLTQM